MIHKKTKGCRLGILAGLVALVGVMLTASGCDLAASDGLLIATSWPLEDRNRLESGFRKWLESPSKNAATSEIRIDWLIHGPGDNPLRLVDRLRPPDLLLGAPAATLANLARLRQLEPIDFAGSPHWLPVRRAASDSDRNRSNAQAPRDLDQMPFDDPRDDPITLARALALVDGGRFAEGYSRLVKVAATGRRIAPRTDTPTNPSDLVEGVAILRPAPHHELAQRFLRFLADARPIEVGSSQPHLEIDPEYKALVVDLLGATLVDAQDELWSAWTALERSGFPSISLKWITEAPPWPPASVAKILAQPGERSMTMLDTLAKQIVPEPAVSAWLVRSWLAPPRLIDKTVLLELARAERGQLCRDPRFRSWLRAEWTAWARQRYRRVRKVASSPLPVARSTNS